MPFVRRQNNWRLLSAIIVNQANVETGDMAPSTLEGFVSAARDLGYSVIDDKKFLREQQERVFAWAANFGGESDRTAAPQAPENERV